MKINSLMSPILSLAMRCQLGKHKDWDLYILMLHFTCTVQAAAAQIRCLCIITTSSQTQPGEKCYMNKRILPSWVSFRHEACLLARVNSICPSTSVSFRHRANGQLCPLVTPMSNAGLLLQTVWSYKKTCSSHSQACVCTTIHGRAWATQMAVSQPQDFHFRMWNQRICFFNKIPRWHWGCWSGSCTLRIRLLQQRKNPEGEKLLGALPVWMSSPVCRFQGLWDLPVSFLSLLHLTPFISSFPPFCFICISIFYFFYSLPFLLVSCFFFFF